MEQFVDLKYTKNKSALQVLSEFAEAQKQSWPLAKANYEGLKSVENKEFQFDGFKIKIQFNPERIRSSAAKVDQKSIAERACFLCNENRPVEQKGILFGKQFLILINPYPIFKNHLTISSNTHVDQRFLVNAKALLELAAAMEGFTVLYNGPESGASAPDHMHFQAGEEGFMPVGEEYEQLKIHSGINLFSGENTQVWAFSHYLRKMISVETTSMDEGMVLMKDYYDTFRELQPEKIEPMMNVLCSFLKGKWIIHLFPRKAHRPDRYFAPGEKQLLISPGSVDLGGVFVVPRKEDFDKITHSDVVDILAQVSLDDEPFAELIEGMKTKMNNK
ncbi:MAG: DUF4922 domain-containing protein [Verrucomicrobia bacterium]|nr:DUF4922 domain-containing protein [Prolixibacteraceae bacterium]